ncbi:MAG: SUMF1/EgtB/PvdO family nonheme iron enzyme [Chloroflexi bacterium]|nr:SUMF1/EgtB/PvdO family nonheme iron enzyme [Chloroflexota bacterium]
MDYLDFELEVKKSGNGDRQYELVAKALAGEAREPAQFPLDTLQLENSLLKLENALVRSGNSQTHRQVLTNEEQAVQDFGRQLFDFLFPRPIFALYARSLSDARRDNKGLRLKLHLVDSALAHLPWEFLHHKDYLCLAHETPLVRYVELDRPVPPLAVVAPLRVLGVLGADYGPHVLDMAQEKERIGRALANLQEKGLIELHWLERPTVEDLQEMLWQGAWHVLHFVGHGDLDDQRDEGFIILANEKGQATKFYAGQLARLTVGHRSLRLAILNACNGAKGGNTLFSSTAHILMERGGLPAIVAMQHAITDTAAIKFAQIFYRALVKGFPIDRATAEARIAMSNAFSPTVEWGIPVLFMRSADGYLFGKVQPSHHVFSGFVPPIKTLEQEGTSKALTINVSRIEWIKIPAGDFWMGNDTVCHLVELPTFWIAKTPITNAQYQKFVQATGHPTPTHWQNGQIPQGKINHPVVHVSWDDGMALAKWASEQAGQTILLPSEAEWEKAARGGLVLSNGQNPLPKRQYPWGDTFDKRKCNTQESGIKDTSPVDKYLQGASPYGVLDLSGNVWEWTRSLYKPYPYVVGDGREDPDNRSTRVRRGGAWGYDRDDARVAYRGSYRPYDYLSYLGLRLVSASGLPSLLDL